MSFSNLLMFDEQQPVVTKLCLLIHHCAPDPSTESGTWQGLNKYLLLDVLVVDKCPSSDAPLLHLSLI